MRSTASAAIPNIAARSVRLYKAHRILCTPSDDRFIVKSSGEDSIPILRAYTTFVVLCVVLVRSNKPLKLRHAILQQGPVIFSKWTVGDFYFWLMEELNRYGAANFF